MFSSRNLFVRIGAKRFVTNLRKRESCPAELCLGPCKHRALKIRLERAFSTSNSRSVAFLHEAAFINNELVQAANGESFQVVNPVNDEVIGSVPDMGVEDTEKAIAAASNAFHSWRERTAKERSQLLKNWFRLLNENTEALAQLMTLEQGKPLAESRGEMAYSNGFIEWFAEEGRRVYGDLVPSPFTTKRLMQFKQPVGVCGLITPWNFPAAMITRKAGAALAAGCTTVVKPAEDTPFSAIALGILAKEAGIPAGVFNVVTASRNKTPDVGKLLCEHPSVRKISFTGSTEVGKTLMRQCADGVKRVSLELGGNAPFIVFDSADLDLAVQGAMGSKFRNSGQTCICSNRFLVHASVHDAFVEKLNIAMSGIRLGNGMDPGVTQGPLINARAVDKIDSLVKDALLKEASLVCGGAVSDHGTNFYLPTLLTDVNLEMDIAHNEIFGPVVSVMKFHSEEEAVAIANATPFGLAGYFFSRDLPQIFRVASRLEYGMLGVNEGLLSCAEGSFGGVKESGLGKESGKYGIDEYLDVKYVCLGGMDGGVC